MLIFSQTAIGKRDHLKVFGSDYPTLAAPATCPSATQTRPRAPKFWAGKLPTIRTTCAATAGTGRAGIPTATTMKEKPMMYPVNLSLGDCHAAV